MEIRRKNRIQETLEFFRGEEETPALTVNVDLNTDDMSAEAKRVWDMLGIATVQLQKTQNEKTLANYGEAVLALFTVLFKDDARKIIAFYENRTEEMLVDLAPFIERVIKQITEARNARMNQFLAAVGKDEAL